MMSMGSLAHYMHDLTRAAHRRSAISCRKGTSSCGCTRRSQGPRGFVRWVAIEERAEGGDALFQAAQRDPRFWMVSSGSRKGAASRSIERQTSGQLPTRQLPTPKAAVRLEGLGVGSWELTERQNRRWTVKFVFQPPRSILSPRKNSFWSMSPLPTGLLPANLAADGPHVAYREANAAKHHRASRPPVGHEPIVVGDVVLEDELADLAVVPVEAPMPAPT